MSKKQFSVSIEYAEDKKKLLKAVCAVSGVSVRAFIANAIDNEVEYMIGNMSETKSKAVQEMLN